MPLLWTPYNGSWTSMGAPATVAFIVVGIAYACVIFYAPILWAAIRLKATKNTPPLPPGKIGFPYLGESLDYLRSWGNLLDLDVWYETRYAKHGGIFTTHILGSPTVVMLGAQANKFVLINENKLFRNSWPKSIRVLIGEHAMVTSQGADHKRMRRIIHSMLGIETLKKSVGRFERLVLHHLNSDWSPGHVIHAHGKLREMALCVAAEYFMGLKAGEEELESFRRHFNDFNAGLLSHPLDLPWTTFGKAKRARAAIVAQIARQIRLRKASLSKIGENDEENFLDMVLRMQIKMEGSECCLSDEEIADNLMGFFTGGYDTTASALATILKHLSLCPHVLQRLRKDCERLKDSKKVGESLTWNEIKGIDYLKNVISEGMRLVPPVIGGFKQAKLDVVYGGYTIPKGWKVHYSIRQTSNREEYFDNPKEFSPERFNERHEPFSNIPFGQGNRICPGNEFAKIEMEIFLYHFVLRYDWDLMEPDEPISISFNPQPKHGFPLRLKQMA